MNIAKASLSGMLLKSSELLIQESDYLSQIDTRFGDGDHGVTMKKIASLIQTSVKQWGNESIKQFIDELGTAVMAIGGGSAGPLWGTLICGLVLPISDDATDIDAGLLKSMLHSALKEMQSITTARVGDKTMMDTLIPAVMAAEAADDNILAILEASAAAARQGAKATENFISKYGRARLYKEQTIGTPDAGAISTMVFFEGLALGAKASLLL